MTAGSLDLIIWNVRLVRPEHPAVEPIARKSPSSA